MQDNTTNKETENKNRLKQLYVKERTTPKQRREKYGFIRQAGVNRNRANQMKDWTIKHIIQELNTRTKEVRKDG